MKKHVHRRHAGRSGHRRTRRAAADRRGSTIVVVIGLLGALLFLGIFVFTISTQEETNAEYYADASKVWTSELSRDELFDWSLRQLIIGPDPISEKQSALFGGHHSLVPTMFGRDLSPYSGSGVRLIWDPAANGGLGGPAVDQDFNGSPDPLPPNESDHPLIATNQSPAALGFIRNFNGDAIRPIRFPDPDAGYTYPDVNSTFMSYRGQAPPAPGVDVEIPSFIRPQYLRNFNNLPPAQWYTNQLTAQRVLRPHEWHFAVDSDGNVTTTRRFISATVPENRADGTPIPQFPFTGPTTGIWGGTPGSVVYDVDADGDGISESIWLDLGFPMQERTTTNGTQTFVPLFGMRVVCADALFNLNAHGNIASMVRPIPGTGPAPPPGLPSPNDPVFGNGQFISKSNQAQSPGEVNPLWGLSAPQATAGDPSQEQHVRYYGHDPANRLELANMEWWWLLTGRPEVDGSGAADPFYPGRWGEVERLRNAVADATGNIRPAKSFFEFSFPGLSLLSNGSNVATADDNRNRDEGGRPAGLQQTPWIHPLDLYGRGRMTNPGVPGGLKSRWLATVGPHKWPLYANYVLHPQVAYRSYGPSVLLQPVPRRQVDDTSETYLEPGNKLGEDDIFGADEAAALQLTNADQALINLFGRVTRLAPVNFKSHVNAEQIRRRFTPVSWDVKSFAKPAYDPAAPNARRSWEFSAVTSGRAFPPNFGTIAAFSPQDPFRSELRQALLTLVPNNPSQQTKFVQRLLSLNHVLDTTQDTGLRFRPLTAHTGQDIDGNGTVDPNEVAPNTPLASIPVADRPKRPEDIGSTLDREYLAVYDRQRLCRDIYVLLYTLGGGDDGLDYTTDNSTGTLYSFDPADPRGDQCREMAQLAVNWVDSLDPDDTITVFEYDTNLNDGWNLDDLPFTEDISFPGTSERHVVAGIEAQQLAFSEALALYARRVLNGGVPENHQATDYNDEDPRHFTYIELENVSPRPVRFDYEGWQVVLRPQIPGTVPGVVGEPRALTLQGAQTPIPPGSNSRFTIGTTSDDENVGTPPGSSTLPSHFMVNPNQGALGDTGVRERIAPRNNLNLDLITDPIGRYRVNTDPGRAVNDPNPGTTPWADGNPPITSQAPQPDRNPTNGPSGRDLLNLQPTTPDSITKAHQGDLGTGSGIMIDMEIRRRVNVARTAPDPGDEDQARDNPWVIVDRMEVPLKVFELNSGDDFDEIQNQLADIQSVERYEPLRAHDPREFIAIPGDFRLNTLGTNNRHTTGAAITEYQLYQPHFDRPLASIAELFTLPLYGPRDLTNELDRQGTRGEANFHAAPAPPVPARLAGHRFLHPQASVPALNNRWYRMLGFVEPQSRGEAENTTFDLYRVSQPVGNPPKHYRTPGRLQLNTISDASHIAGLLDAPELLTPAFTDPTNPTRITRLDSTAAEGSGRDWWLKFLQARDNIDPVSGAFLPGLPDSRPFRSLGYSALGPASIEHTLLRRLTDNSGAPLGDGRRLFDIGTPTDIDGNRANGEVDPTLRHGLLQKVANNSTNRSHVFFVFLQVDFFEAKEVTAGSGTVVRVGAKLDDSPGYRGFFVVDRSKALELAQPGHLPTPYNDPATGTQNFNFAFKQNFPWQSLVLHRQTIK